SERHAEQGCGGREGKGRIVYPIAADLFLPFPPLSFSPPHQVGFEVMDATTRAEGGASLLCLPLSLSSSTAYNPSPPGPFLPPIPPGGLRGYRHHSQAGGPPPSPACLPSHQVGFEVIDAVARAEGISLSAMQSKAVVGKGRIAACPVLLVKPQTFMNLSGESVGPLARFYKIPPERVIAIYDDMDLDVASMKLLAKGGHGGHNG
ncbi:unnamed protein product, partial [Closterium sp. NIES-54]